MFLDVESKARIVKRTFGGSNNQDVDEKRSKKSHLTNFRKPSFFINCDANSFKSFENSLN
jgi:hypothetical protein